jgi:ethanolamine utilization protein EutN
MRIGKVIGNLTLSAWHPTLTGASYKLAIPMTWNELANDAAPSGEELIVYDDLNAGIGATIAISEGGEAAQPFTPDMKPIDAYNAAILDQISIHEINIAHRPKE